MEAANALIANNTNRYRKSLRSHHRATVRPIYRKNVLVDTIRDLVASAERSGYKPGDIAIIARKNKALEKIKKSLDGFYLATSPKTLLIKDEVFIAIRDTFSLYVTNFHDPLALYRQLKRNGYADQYLHKLVGSKLFPYMTELPISAKQAYQISEQAHNIRGKKLLYTKHDFLELLFQMMKEGEL